MSTIEAALEKRVVTRLHSESREVGLSDLGKIIDAHHAVALKDATILLTSANLLKEFEECVRFRCLSSVFSALLSGFNLLHDLIEISLLNLKLSQMFFIESNELVNSVNTILDEVTVVLRVQVDLSEQVTKS